MRRTAARTLLHGRVPGQPDVRYPDQPYCRGGLQLCHAGGGHYGRHTTAGYSVQQDDGGAGSTGGKLPGWLAGCLAAYPPWRTPAHPLHSWGGVRGSLGLRVPVGELPGWGMAEGSASAPQVSQRSPSGDSHAAASRHATAGPQALEVPQPHAGGQKVHRPARGTACGRCAAATAAQP